MTGDLTGNDLCKQSSTRLRWALLCIGTALTASCAAGEDFSASTGERLQDFEAQAPPADAVTSEAVGSQALPVDNVAPHAVGQQALLVRWQDTEVDQQLEELNAVVSNTTSKDLTTELVLSMRAPDGQVVEEVLREVQLAPQQKLTVAIAAHELPLQSAGVASTLELFVRYQVVDRHALLSTPSPPSARTVISRAPLMYVTHDPAFETVSLRTAKDEARINGALYQAGKQPKLQEIRGPLARTVRGAAAAEVPVQLIMSLPPGAPGSPPPPQAR